MNLAIAVPCPACANAMLPVPLVAETGKLADDGTFSVRVSVDEAAFSEHLAAHIAQVHPRLADD